MRFRIADLPAQRSFALTEEFVRDALAAIPGQDQLDPPAKPDEVLVELEVTVENETVFARGTLRGQARVACSRCVGAVELGVNEDFQLTFLPRAQFDDKPAEPDAEIDEDDLDLDLAAHDGTEVNVAPVLRDHVVLSVPYAPLCSDDCKGLCDQCGANLNETTCDCKSPTSESPWTALEQLKKTLPKSST